MVELVSVKLDLKDSKRFYPSYSKESKDIVDKIRDINLFKKACFYLAKYDGNFYLIKNRNDERNVNSLDVLKQYNEKKILKVSNSSLMDYNELDNLRKDLYENNGNLYVYIEF